MWGFAEAYPEIRETEREPSEAERVERAIGRLLARSDRPLRGIFD